MNYKLDRGDSDNESLNLQRSKNPNVIGIIYRTILVTCYIHTIGTYILQVLRRYMC